MAEIKVGSIASGDYRDGVAYGAQELRRRLERAWDFGLVPDYHDLRRMADTLMHEYGGIDKGADADG